MINVAALQKEKCKFGGCEHTPESLGEETHSEGVCWKITQKDLENLPTDTKYCPCKQENGLIRTFKRTGYMEVAQYDSMVTKTCISCGKDLLIRVAYDKCSKCLDSDTDK